MYSEKMTSSEEEYDLEDHKLLCELHKWEKKEIELYSEFLKYKLIQVRKDVPSSQSNVQDNKHKR